MSAYGFSTYRPPPASQRPQGPSPTQLNPWHQPQTCTPTCRRPRRRLMLQCAAVDQELDVVDSFAARGMQRHDPLGHDLPEGLDIVIRGDEIQEEYDEHQDSDHIRIKYQLKQTVSLLQLRMLLESECSNFDPINTSRAMALLLRIHRGVMQQLRRAGMYTKEAVGRHRAEHLEPCLVVMDSLVRQHTGDMDAWGVSSVLWAYAHLDHYDRHLFEGLCGRALQLQDTLKPVDCANIMWAFGHWGHYQPELLKAITQAMLDHMYDAKPSEVSQTLWGFARLRVAGVPGRPFLAAICEVVKPTLHLYPSQELSTILWSLAKLRFYPGNTFLQQVESIMLRRVRGSGPRRTHTPQHHHHDQHHASDHAHNPMHTDNEAVNGVSMEHTDHNVNGVPSHVRMGAANTRQSSHPTPHMAFQPRPAPPREIITSQDLGLVLWALGQFKFKAAKLLDEVPLCLPSWLPHFSIKDICCLLVGYTHARHYHAGLLEVIAPLVTQHLHTLSINELIGVLWSYGMFQHRPVSEPRFLPTLSAVLIDRIQHGGRQRGQWEGAGMDEVMSGLSSLRPQTYSLMVKACANLQFRPEPLLRMAVQASASRLQEFRPDEMANLLYGLSHLASRAPACELPPAGTPVDPQSVVNGVANGVPRGRGGAAASSVVAPTVVAVADGEVPGPHPALEPEEMQLFYGVVRRCMRLLDEPNHPYGSRNFMHHRVLNSILFSCLRIGYTPWALIDFAESKGMRLTSPRQLKEADWEAAESAAIRQASGGLAGTSTSTSTTAAPPSTIPRPQSPPRAPASLPGRAHSGQVMPPPAEFDSRYGTAHDVDRPGSVRPRSRSAVHRGGMSGGSLHARSRARQPLFSSGHEHEEAHQDGYELNGQGGGSSNDDLYPAPHHNEGAVYLAGAAMADHLSDDVGVNGVNGVNGGGDHVDGLTRPWRGSPGTGLGQAAMPILHTGLTPST